jgi:tetratricopeptide (TPR) repeat protein
MRKHTIVSLLVAVVLSVALVAPAATVEVSPVNRSYAFSFVTSGDSPTTAGAAKSEKKGNGFVRAITAPFRAIGRLFGGGPGKKERTEVAPAEIVKQAGAGVEAEVAGDLEASKRAEAESARAAERLRKAEEKERRRLEKEQQRAANARPIAESALATSSPAENASTPAPKIPSPPIMWKPYIENVPLDHLSQGRALLEYGYYSEAIAELSIAATVGPDLIEANNLLGQAYDRIGAHRHAQEYYERALNAAPANPSALFHLGHSLYLSGNAGEALRRLKQAARIAPNDAEIVNSIALVQVRLGKYGDAFKSFARVEGEFHARLKLAQALTDLNLPHEAIKQYEAALRIQPQSPIVLEHLSVLYQRTGQLKEAEAARRLLDKQSNKPLTGGGG